MLYILFVIILILLYAVYNLYRKTTIYEKWVIELRSRIKTGYDKLVVYDNKKIFESDDEVGYFFKLLKSTIEYIDELK